MCSVIAGWSEGPELRCAIAHRGISRFAGAQLRTWFDAFASPRNDGVARARCMTALKLGLLDAAGIRQPYAADDSNHHPAPRGASSARFSAMAQPAPRVRMGHALGRLHCTQ